MALQRHREVAALMGVLLVVIGLVLAIACASTDAKNPSEIAAVYAPPVWREKEGAAC